MYLKVTYGWFDEENRGKTEELDKALQDCLDEQGFFQTQENWGQTKVERRKLRREHKNKAAYRP